MTVAGQTFARQGYLAPVDLLVDMGWLTPAKVEDWRRGRVPYLERVTEANMSKLGRALRITRQWADQHQMRPSLKVYTSWTKPRHRLRFTKTGDPNLELAYSTHWLAARAADGASTRDGQPG